VSAWDGEHSPYDIISTSQVSLREPHMHFKRSWLGNVYALLSPVSYGFDPENRENFVLDPVLLFSKLT